MHNWIDEVLVDLKSYAELNNLHRLDEDITLLLERWRETVPTTKTGTKERGDVVVLDTFARRAERND